MMENIKYYPRSVQNEILGVDDEDYTDYSQEEAVMSAHTRMFVPCNQCGKLMPTIEWEHSGGRCCPTPEEEQALISDIANSQPYRQEEVAMPIKCPTCGRFLGAGAVCINCVPIKDTHENVARCPQCSCWIDECNCTPQPTLARIIDQVVAHNNRDCGPGRHRFPGGSQYCSHCGITRTDLAKSFPIK